MSHRTAAGSSHDQKHLHTPPYKKPLPTENEGANSWPTDKSLWRGKRTQLGEPCLQPLLVLGHFPPSPHSKWVSAACPIPGLRPPERIRLPSRPTYLPRRGRSPWGSCAGCEWPSPSSRRGRGLWCCSGPARTACPLAQRGLGEARGGNGVRAFRRASSWHRSPDNGAPPLRAASRQGRVLSRGQNTTELGMRRNKEAWSGGGGGSPALS